MPGVGRHLHDAASGIDVVPASSRWTTVGEDDGDTQFRPLRHARCLWLVRTAGVARRKAATNHTSPVAPLHLLPVSVISTDLGTLEHGSSCVAADEFSGTSRSVRCRSCEAPAPPNSNSKLNLAFTANPDDLASSGTTPAERRGGRTLSATLLLLYLQELQLQDELEVGRLVATEEGRRPQLSPRHGTCVA